MINLRLRNCLLWYKLFRVSDTEYRQQYESCAACTEYVAYNVRAFFKEILETLESRRRK